LYNPWGSRGSSGHQESELHHVTRPFIQPEVRRPNHNNVFECQLVLELNLRTKFQCNGIRRERRPNPLENTVGSFRRTEGMAASLRPTFSLRKRPGIAWAVDTGPTRERFQTNHSCQSQTVRYLAVEPRSHVSEAKLGYRGE
jgi:hypothetical protein